MQLAVGADVKLVLTDQLDNVLNVEEALKLLAADFDLNNNYNYQLAEQNVKMARDLKLEQIQLEPESGLETGSRGILVTLKSKKTAEHVYLRQRIRNIPGVLHLEEL